MAEENEEQSLEYTSTWRLATVCLIFVIISVLLASGIHRLGKILKMKKLKAFRASLEKMKEELMLIGFISLLLAAFQGPINHICIPKNSTKILLPCKKNVEEDFSIERLDSKVGHCEKKGMEPFLSMEGLHQLDIFICVLAITHIIFCVTTMLLGYIKIRSWKHWEFKITNKRKEDEMKMKQGDLNQSQLETSEKTKKKKFIHVIHHAFIKKHAPYEMSLVMSWVISFLKQFWGSVNESDYTTMRLGFIKYISSGTISYNFYKYMIRNLEEDFEKVVGIRWYLWIYVIIFLLLNNHGWHVYFYICFIPLILLFILGAKLEHIMIQLAQEFRQKNTVWQSSEIELRPSNEHFWFNRPQLLVYLIHFILFQNAFEIAYFVWVLITFGFRSCIMGRVVYVIPRLVVGLIVQVLCSYSTLPLYALVTQMVTKHKMTLFSERIGEDIMAWYKRSQKRVKKRNKLGNSNKDERKHEVGNPARDIEMPEINAPSNQMAS
ncbi:hypothetical protein SUGI_0097550 [Cryptomeria japonica]|uniref:MLO-like protein 1 n=1 Tax=Cryptomeria japonica TaxID=3369 RepID=UPI002408CCED|nr:MLO-like protein 1 [Cryptomeria japonica]GLJ08882.1 hypothetical protein SUGI_0097550 [Cryptomeria japonica]